MSRRSAWIGLALIVLTCSVFGRVLGFEFTIWDDNIVVWANPLLNPPSFEHTLQFWKEPYYTLYLPVTYTLWAIMAAAGWSDTPDAWGNHLNPYLFHGLNLALHVACVLAVWRLILRVVRNEVAAGLGAMLFALHPVQVEAVAWVTATRDLLGTFFSVVAVLAFLDFRDARTSARRWMKGGIATLLFVAALFSKPTAVVTPIFAALVALLTVIGDDVLSAKKTEPGRVGPVEPKARDFERSDGPAVRPGRHGPAPIVGQNPVASVRYWGLGRAEIGLLSLWLIGAVADALITRIKQPVDPAILRNQPPLWFRPIVALDALAFDVWKLVWPVRLGIDYGRTPLHIRQTGQWMWTWIIPVLIVGILFKMGRRAWICAAIFVVGLLPLLGLTHYRFQVYYGTVADRYLYPAMIGISLGVALIWSKITPKSRAHSMALGAAIVLLAICGTISFHQLSYWRDSMSLFNRAIEVNPRSFAGYQDRGAVENHDGQFEAAARDFNTVLEISPGASEGYRGLARAHMGLGRVDESLGDWDKALAAEKATINGHGEMGADFRRQLVQHYSEAAAMAEGVNAIERARVWREQAAREFRDGK